MTSKSDFEHWKIEATVHKDRIEEIHYITDPGRNIRRKRQVKVWRFDRLLGRGSFGEVRLQKDAEDGNLRAVKRIPAASTNLSSREFEKELKALLEFSKPKFKEAAVFVDFFGWFEDDSDVLLAMEYFPLGDLENNVAASSGTIPEIEARDITEQILLGLEIMHAESFAHRDLKPQNVLVVNGPPKWWVKLADFGLSKRLTESTLYQTKIGTQSYMAPEILDYLDMDAINGEYYTNAVDLWAVGCIAYRIVTGVVPFSPGRSLMNYCDNKSLFPYDPLLDSGIKSLGSRFIRELLAPQPEERPSASQALNHAWIMSGSISRKPTEDLSNPAQGMPGISDLSITDNAEHSISPSRFESQTTNSLSSSTVPRRKKRNQSSNRVDLESATEITSPLLSQVRHLQSQIRHLQDLESDNRASTSDTDTSYTEPSSQSRSETDSNLSSASHDLTVKRKPLPTLPRAEELSTTNKPTSMLKYTVTSLRTLKGHTHWVWYVAFSPDGKLLASASGDNTVRLWDTATGATLRIFEEDEHPLPGFHWIWSVAFSGNGKVIAVASDSRAVQLWDAATGIPLHTLKGHTESVRSVAFSPDSKVVASGSIDMTVRLWDVATGAALQTLHRHTGSVRTVAFSPDGKLLASGVEDHTIYIWDAATGSLLHTLREHERWIWAVTFSHDSKILASASEDQNIRLWDVATGAALQTLSGHTRPVRSVAFSLDDKVLVSASEDETIRFWDIETGASQTLKGHAGWVSWVDFSPDGRVLASASVDTTVRLWDVDGI